jgi:hypothetical protein
MVGPQFPEPLPNFYDHVTLSHLNALGRSLSLSQKKEVMTALRVGKPPRWSRRMRVKKAYGSYHNDPVTLRDVNGYDTEVITMHDVWHMVDPFLQTPVRRSILSLFLRSSPLTFLKSTNLGPPTSIGDRPMLR